MGNESRKPRRILEVDVKEVSMVDRPANLRRFLVIKRIEEEEGMSNFEDEKITKAEEEMTAEEKKAKAAAEEEMTAEEKKAKAEEEEMTAEEKEAQAKKEKTAKAANPKAVAGMLSGIKGLPKAAADEVISALQAMKAVKQEEEEMEDEEKKEKTTKSEAPVLVIHADGQIDVGESALQKRLQFTSGRTKALTDAASTLAKLVAEVDPDAAKSIMAAMKELPSNAKVPSAVKPTGVGSVKKDEGSEELTKALATIADLTKRLEKVEKTRAPSKSIDEDGGTDEEVTKSEGTWTGVL